MGELAWDNFGNITLDLGDYCFGKATASSVKEKAAVDKHTRIHVCDVPIMLEPLLSSSVLNGYWKQDSRWGDFLYLECQNMPQRVEVYSGGMLCSVGEWIKIHFQNDPKLSLKKIYQSIMMAHHARLGARSALQMVHEDLLRLILCDFVLE